MISTCSAIPCTTFRSLSTSLQVQLLSLLSCCLVFPLSLPSSRLLLTSLYILYIDISLFLHPVRILTSWTNLRREKLSHLYSLSSFFRLSSLALQMSTSERVRYIHNLCRHISNTAGRLLGIDDTLLLMSFVPRRLTVVINKMSLKRKRQRSFLIQGEELVVTRSCRRRTRLEAAKSL